MKQRGTAIITALFIMALVVIAATTIALRLELNISHTELSVSSNQMAVARQSAIEWSRLELAKIINDKSVSTPVEPLEFNETIDSIAINAEIIDAQQRFNINLLQRTSQNFQDAKNEPIMIAFQRLIQSVDKRVTKERAQTIAFQIANEMRAANPYANRMPKVLERFKSIKFIENLERDVSSRTSRSYASLYHPAVSISEIRSVRGVNQSLFNKLKPYLVALPSMTPININTAPLPIINMLHDQLTLESTQLLINERNSKRPFKNINEFLALPIAKSMGLKNPLNLPVTVRSQYFLMTVELKRDQFQQRWLVLTQIRKINNKPKVVVLWQSLAEVD